MTILFLTLTVMACGGYVAEEDLKIILTVYPGQGLNELKFDDLGSGIVETLGSDYSGFSHLEHFAIKI